MELLKQILAPGVVVAIVSVAAGSLGKYFYDKRNKRYVDERDSDEQLREMRAAAEIHLLEYDVPMLERMMQHEALINQQRVTTGQEPVVFPPLPTPTPLFPKRKDGR